MIPFYLRLTEKPRNCLRIIILRGGRKGRSHAVLPVLLLSIVFALFLGEMSAVAKQSPATYPSQNISSLHQVVRVGYRVNSSHFEPSFSDNAAALSDFKEMVRLLDESGGIVTGVVFCGGASPEGNYDANIKLARARRESFEKYVRGHINIDESKVSRRDVYFPWEELKEKVSQSDIDGKEDVLSVLELAGDRLGRGGIGDEEITARLKALGSPWEELNRRYFSSMRNAFAIFTTIFDEIPEIDISEIEVPEIETEIEEEFPPLDNETISCALLSVPTEPLTIPIEVKTNGLLLLSTLNANVGFEVGIGKHFSVDAIGTYSPWNLFRQDRKIRLFGVQPEVRYWVKGEPLVKGHFVGLHTTVYGFNVQFNDKYRYQDPNRAVWGIGLTYGFAMPLKAGTRWGIEFVVGAGYMDISWDQYDGARNGLMLKTGETDYWGITRLGVDISYRFDVKCRRRK